MSNNGFRLAIVVSHPIQHFCPQYISFSKLPGVTVKLFFASMLGYKKYADKNFGQEVVWNNLRLEEFDHVFMNGEQVLPSSAELDAPTLPQELDNFKPDAVLSYGYFQKFQRRGHQWAIKNKVPIAYITDAENRQHRKLLKKLAKLVYVTWYFKKINYFFTVGNANEQYYQHYGVPQRKFVRMHYPIDIDVYRAAYEKKNELRDEIRSKLNIALNAFVMGVVGKLVEWKNQDHMVDLLANLESKGIDAEVILLGTGKTMDAIKEKATVLKKNKIHFAGFVDPLDLPKYYAALDLYVHPARIEPHSLAISEAIYMGCPIVLSDRCGSYGEDDDVQVGKNGFVYHFGDIEALAGNVQKLITDKTLREKFSAYSREISQKFQKRSHGDCVLDLASRIKNNR